MVQRTCMEITPTAHQLVYIYNLLFGACDPWDSLLDSSFPLAQQKEKEKTENWANCHGSTLRKSSEDYTKL